MNDNRQKRKKISLTLTATVLSLLNRSNFSTSSLNLENFQSAVNWNKDTFFYCRNQMTEQK